MSHADRGPMQPLPEGRALPGPGAVGVLLVNWNGGELTLDCIASLVAGTRVPECIVVVDNASRDGSPDRIVERFPQVVMLRNDHNAGFTGANNRGIAWLLEAGYSYVWILNNDTTVTPTCLQALWEHAEAHPEVAASSGKIHYDGPGPKIWYAGSSYDPVALRYSHDGQDELDHGQHDRSREVPFLSGCCMFVRRPVLELLGGFDDCFFAYAEDSDWCLRARNRGLSLAYVPAAVLVHKVSASVNALSKKQYGGSTSPFTVYITSRNQLYVVRKHAASTWQRFTALGVFSARTTYYATALLLLGRRAKLEALALAVYDGLRAPLTPEKGQPLPPRYVR